MKKILIGLCLLLCIVAVGQSVYILHPEYFSFTKSFIQPLPKPKPLLAYTFVNLAKDTFPATPITLGPVTADYPDYFSQIFFYTVPVRPHSTTLEKVSGLVNIPKKEGNHPVIVMFRGFVPDNIYKPGVGTQPVASVFAKAGFITLAPDFLGYGQSASPAADPFENRFQTYTTAATLLTSLSTLPNALFAKYQATVSVDMTKIGIWAHSNGGHIALSTLAITGVTYPTVLWAPVSTSFPYDILYYTNESDDQGKSLRKVLANFETTYDTDQFSPSRYYNWIKAPLEIDQGTADREVPVWWSDDLVASLQKDAISVTYHTYTGADHNLLPSGWTQAVANNIDFYTKQFAK